MVLIERQAAIDAVHKNYDTILDFKSDGRTVADSFEDIINTLPPAQPERKTGRWVSQKGGGYCCSECGRYALDEVDGNFIHVAFESNFCPYCGVEMVEK